MKKRVNFNSKIVVHRSTIGSRLRRQRKKLGISQKHMASIIGVSSGYICALEHKLQPQNTEIYSEIENWLVNTKN